MPLFVPFLPLLAAGSRIEFDISLGTWRRATRFSRYRQAARIELFGICEIRLGR